jgi:hypothetical protein
MPLELEFHTSLRKLLVGLILILVPLTVLGFYVALQGDNHVRRMVGEHFRSLTRTAAESTADFIADRVRDVSLIANGPGAMQAVAQANRQYEHLSPEAVRAKISASEDAWGNWQTDTLAAGILSSDLAQHLRRMRELDPMLLKITVLDMMGSTVAATDRPAYYSQTSQEFWQPLSSSGRGAIQLSAVRYDDQTRLYYISISYPILQAGTGRFIGAVTATADVSPLFAQLNRRQIGGTGRLFLVSGDGTVINAPGVTPSLKMKSEEFAAIRDALGSLQGREAGYIYTSLSNRESYLIGFADTGLADSYANLPWIIVASQETKEITGPVRSMVAFAFIVMTVALLLLTLLAVYVFSHRPLELDDIEATDDKTRPVAA